MQAKKRLEEDRRKLEVASEVEKTRKYQIHTPSRVEPIPITGRMEPQNQGGGVGMRKEDTSNE